jgi:tetratricopeptide (TPR) repeat protein
LVFYSTYVLGAIGSDLAAMSWFFDRPYETPAASLRARDRSWVLATAGVYLVGQGRLNEAIPAHREALRAAEADKDWSNAAAAGSNLCRALLLVGEVAASIVTAQRAIAHADQGEIEDDIVARRSSYAAALHAAGRYVEAEEQFADAERRQKKSRPCQPFLYSSRGHQYCDLLMSNGNYVAARDRATETIAIARQTNGSAISASTH